MILLCGNQATLDVPADDLHSLHAFIHSAFGLDQLSYYLRCSGRVTREISPEPVTRWTPPDSLGSETDARESIVYLHLRCLGGKGGFGTLLRRKGMKVKIRNFESSRTLDGRRVGSARVVLRNGKPVLVKDDEIEQPGLQKEAITEMLGGKDAHPRQKMSSVDVIQVYGKSHGLKITTPASDPEHMAAVAKANKLKSIVPTTSGVIKPLRGLFRDTKVDHHPKQETEVMPGALDINIDEFL